jgi:hypothetical protein
MEAATHMEHGYLDSFMAALVEGNPLRAASYVATKLSDTDYDGQAIAMAILYLAHVIEKGRAVDSLNAITHELEARVRKLDDRAGEVLNAITHELEARGASVEDVK